MTTAGLTRIRDAIADVGPPPCDGCQHTQRCATRRTACEAFYCYVAGGGSRGRPPLRVPSWRWWMAAFPPTDEEQGRGGMSYRARMQQGRLVERAAKRLDEVNGELVWLEARTGARYREAES